MASIDFNEVHIDGIDGMARAAGLKEWLLRSSGHHSQPVRIPILKGVTFSARTGDRIGVVGSNGAGKSSLLRAIAGIYPPKSGTVKVSGKVAPLIEMGVGMNANLTGRQNIKLGLLYNNRLSEYCAALENEIIAFAELGEKIDVPYKYYSSGMSARLAFAISIFQHPDILLLDEVFAVGDQNFVAKAKQAMRDKFESVAISILVTHETAPIASMCNRCLWLDQGRIRADGTPAEILDMYHHALNAV
jgi:lipopolysaccharide transport system ATP-binding protein